MSEYKKINEVMMFNPKLLNDYEEENHELEDYKDKVFEWTDKLIHYFYNSGDIDGLDEVINEMASEFNIATKPYPHETLLDRAIHYHKGYEQALVDLKNSKLKTFEGDK
ncbi:MAG: hypothetical protein R3230_01310 [Nitrosopumilaceae archaeon]|nr:hypothetical protein [Nitrosopumilaceae archaeon]